MPDAFSDPRLEGIFNVAAAMKLKITHVHEDLVFVEHNNVLFVLDPDDAAAVRVRFNRECKPAEARAYADQVANAAGAAPDLKLAYGGSYALAPGDQDGQLRLEFFE